MDIRSMFIRIVMGVLIGCGGRPAELPITLNNDKWNVGDSIWFRVAVIDSVHSNDSAFEHSQKHKAVLLIVLGTGPSTHLRWQEFGLLSVAGDSATLFDPPEWIPTYPLEYTCDPDGRIERSLNYPEIRAVSDTLVRIYLPEATGLSTEQAERLYEWTMDSARLVDGLMSHTELFHTPFGISFTNDMVAWAEIPGMIPAYHGARFRWERAPNPLCDPATTVSFLLRAEVDSIYYEDLVPDSDPRSPVLDTLMSQDKPVFISLDCCFDTSRDFPILIEQVLRFQMKELSLKRTTVIHLDERWTAALL